MTINAAAARAWIAFQSGDPAGAARLYREALRDEPDNADLWCLLGIVQRAAASPAEAAASYREALRLRPEFVEAWNNLGNALISEGKADEAVAAFEHVLRLRPGYAEAHNNLAAALRQQGKWAEATAHYREALRLKPDYADAHNNLGVALQGMGRLEEAEAGYRQALCLKPNYPEALTNRGSVLTRLGRLDEAEADHREALRLRPDYVEAQNNMGTLMTARRKYAEAEACYREALRLKPDYAEGRHNLGTALAEQGRIDEAVACYREALRLKPDYAEACVNLAAALLMQSQPDEAVAVYDDILRRGKPESPDAHLGRAIAFLVKGDWDQGWKEYEWRWRCEEFGGLPYKQPQWDGSPLDGRTILLHAEQGAGDALLFVRYARLVKSGWHAFAAPPGPCGTPRDGEGPRKHGTPNVVLACPKALLRLLATCPGIDQLVGAGDPLPVFDCHAPLLSLAGLFGTTPENAPADIPYLFADPGLVEHWRRELAPDFPRFKVGVVWQGNPRYKGDRQRSIPLARFEPLARTPGVRLFSLQKGFGSEQLRDADFPVVDLGPRLDEASGPFMDTAAVMKNLDLIVTPDTAVAHLAGALGVPVWLALAYSPHWVWMLARGDTPWYPSMRLFRQRRWGDWDEVFGRMAVELGQLAAAPRRAGPLLVETAPAELLDKIVILQIKSERITDPDKLRNVRRELAVLEAARDRAVPSSDKLTSLTARLKAINEELWQIEDNVRRCEHTKDFGRKFVALARAVYLNNDRRAKIKRLINDLLGSDLKEEKSYGVGG
jgi:tetratricopeptide (TPR) repeat protein